MRMGPQNKLLLPLPGTNASLIENTLHNLGRSNIDRIHIITGHEADGVEQTIKKSELLSSDIKSRLTFVHNPAYKEGLGASIRCGMATLANKTDGVLIMQGDMPFVQFSTLNRLTDHFAPDYIIIPEYKGRRGNPVLWGRSFFKALSQLDGDVGGKKIIEIFPQKKITVEMDDEGILTDVDTLDDLRSSPVPLEDNHLDSAKRLL